MSQPFETLNPLLKQEESEELEIQIRESFREAYTKTLAPKVHSLLHYGSPHLTNNIDLMKKWYLSDGLSIPRHDTELEQLQYLLKAWRIKNPKRGFHFLRTYLQILYPNEWRIDPLWQEKNQPYPNVRTKEDADIKGTPHWLTSRVRVSITSMAETGKELASYRPTLQAIIGARFLLELEVLREFGSNSFIYLANANAVSAIHSEKADCIVPQWEYTHAQNLFMGDDTKIVQIHSINLGETQQ
ncbi:MAG: hypothetical protein SPE06_00155 [[Actinobacillus] rossii]|nr:hypothetical protein [[Actinobacillus] rossii]MDY4504830.1 hypothetical protein [[Actinobacillus] rossii]